MKTDPYNRLLAKLPRSVRSALHQDLEEVDLPLRMVLYETLEKFEFVYFLNEGVASLVVVTDMGPVEAATIGNEGMVGIHAFLGADRSPTQAFMQIAGRGYRMPIKAFDDHVKKNRTFSNLLHIYTSALMTQITQSTGCNRAHSMDQRCARWLLMTHDRVASDEFMLTQQFLAQMLGVRRATVSVAAGLLARRGLITYTRGVIRILDRKGLELAACECYEVIRSEYDRLLGPSPPP